MKPVDIPRKATLKQMEAVEHGIEMYGSLRAFARALECGSGHLCYVRHGKANMGVELAIKVSKLLPKFKLNVLRPDIA